MLKAHDVFSQHGFQGVLHVCALPALDDLVRFRQVCACKCCCCVFVHSDIRHMTTPSSTSTCTSVQINSVHKNTPPSPSERHPCHACATHQAFVAHAPQWNKHPPSAAPLQSQQTGAVKEQCGGCARVCVCGVGVGHSNSVAAVAAALMQEFAAVFVAAETAPSLPPLQVLAFAASFLAAVDQAGLPHLTQTDPPPPKHCGLCVPFSHSVCLPFCCCCSCVLPVVMRACLSFFR